MLLILNDKPGFGIHLGHNVFKIQLAISSKGKGKSGVARIITYLDNDAKELYLVFIYEKNQLDNFTIEQLLELLKKAGLTNTK